MYFPLWAVDRPNLASSSNKVHTSQDFLFLAIKAKERETEKDISSKPQPRQQCLSPTTLTRMMSRESYTTRKSIQEKRRKEEEEKINSVLRYFLFFQKTRCLNTGTAPRILHGKRRARKAL
jgi:hypothetical protein